LGKVEARITCTIMKKFYLCQRIKITVDMSRVFVFDTQLFLYPLSQKCLAVMNNALIRHILIIIKKKYLRDELQNFTLECVWWCGITPTWYVTRHTVMDFSKWNYFFIKKTITKIYVDVGYFLYSIICKTLKDPQNYSLVKVGESNFQILASKIDSRIERAELL
jgi:hypothetical protein